MVTGGGWRAAREVGRRKDAIDSAVSDVRRAIGGIQRAPEAGAARGRQCQMYEGLTGVTGGDSVEINITVKKLYY